MLAAKKNFPLILLDLRKMIRYALESYVLAELPIRDG